MDLQGKKSSQSKKMWIIIGAFIALVVLGAAAYAVMTATMPKKQETTNNTAVRSEAEIKKDIFRAKDKLDKAIEQDKVDHQAVQDAIDDHVKRVKLTN